MFPNSSLLYTVKTCILTAATSPLKHILSHFVFVPYDGLYNKCSKLKIYQEFHAVVLFVFWQKHLQPFLRGDPCFRLHLCYKFSGIIKAVSAECRRVTKRAKVLLKVWRVCVVRSRCVAISLFISSLSNLFGMWRHEFKLLVVRERLMTHLFPETKLKKLHT